MVVDVFVDDGAGSGAFGSVEDGVVVVVLVSVWVAVDSAGGFTTVTLGAGGVRSWIMVFVPGSVTTVGAAGVPADDKRACHHR